MLPKYKEVVVMDEQVKLPGSKFHSDDNQRNPTVTDQILRVCLKL
jgi:hypothetical protein